MDWFSLMNRQLGFSGYMMLPLSKAIRQCVAVVLEIYIIISIIIFNTGHQIMFLFSTSVIESAKYISNDFSVKKRLLSRRSSFYLMLILDSETRNYVSPSWVCRGGRKSITPCTMVNSYITNNGALTKTYMELIVVIKYATTTFMEKDFKIEDLIWCNERLSWELSIEDRNHGWDDFHLTQTMSDNVTSAPQSVSSDLTSYDSLDGHLGVIQVFGQSMLTPKYVINVTSEDYIKVWLTESKRAASHKHGCIKLAIKQSTWV